MPRWRVRTRCRLTECRRGLLLERSGDPLFIFERRKRCHFGKRNRSGKPQPNRIQTPPHQRKLLNRSPNQNRNLLPHRLDQNRRFRKNLPMIKRKSSWMREKNFSEYSSNLLTGIEHGIFGEISSSCLPAHSRIRWIKVTMTNERSAT